MTWLEADPRGEIIAGIQEFVVGNTFGATAFVIYGGFWFSLGAVYMPGLGIIGGSCETPLDPALVRHQRLRAAFGGTTRAPCRPL